MKCFLYILVFATICSGYVWAASTGEQGKQLLTKYIQDKKAVLNTIDGVLQILTVIPEVVPEPEAMFEFLNEIACETITDLSSLDGRGSIGMHRKPIVPMHYHRHRLSRAHILNDRQIEEKDLIKEVCLQFRVCSAQITKELNTAQLTLDALSKESKESDQPVE